MHGLALNLTVSLEPFEWFHPCGIASASTTSLERICGVAPRPEEAAKTLGAAIGEVLGLDVIDTIDCQG